MINLNEVGAFASAPTVAGVSVRFGLYLPGITSQAGYDVVVRVIHKNDRFDPDILPLDFHLDLVPGSPNNLWQQDVVIPPTSGTNFGLAGTYLYRYQLWQTTGGNRNLVTNWFTDPFARATDEVGQLSAFAAPAATGFQWHDQAWKVPELEHLVVYELQIEEFNRTFDGVIERLPYLKSLGITCLELMPITSLKLDFDWGYGPLHYFTPNERWGGAQGFKRLVDACHTAGIAVILDVVYQHVAETFPYYQVYRDAGITSPMINGLNPLGFGPQIDFSKEFAHEYVQAANTHWLHEYQVDGFRYDEVSELYDGATGSKYARIAYETYGESLTIPRFTPSGGSAPGEYSRMIQCAEALTQPREILQATYSNGTWQNELLDKVEQMAQFHFVDDDFVHLLDTRFSGYPDTKTVHDIAGNPVDMPVAPFQYLESHDHSQLIYYIGAQPVDIPVVSGSKSYNKLDIPFGDRSKFSKLQPFAIALYTCQGTPMLWQGQEFADNYYLPDDGNARITIQRDVNWEYFYDDSGASLVRLYRILGRLRHTCPALRSRESFYFNTQSRPGDGVVAYKRYSTTAGQVAMVYLNFSDVPQSISVPFPELGTYQEMIDGQERIQVNTLNQTATVEVPSNYGYIFIK
ncbi:MAG: alpha-amylase family glycosyl hydrolase [Ktedonobacteraceae bacterium]